MIQKRCNIRWIVSNSCDIVVLQKQIYREGRKMVVAEIQPTKKIDEKIRLAAYCRVSSDSSDQMNSFAA